MGSFEIFHLFLAVTACSLAKIQKLHERRDLQNWHSVWENLAIDSYSSPMHCCYSHSSQFPRSSQQPASECYDVVVVQEAANLLVEDWTMIFFAPLGWVVERRWKLLQIFDEQTQNWLSIMNQQTPDSFICCTKRPADNGDNSLLATNHTIMLIS